MYSTRFSVIFQEIVQYKKKDEAKQLETKMKPSRNKEIQEMEKNLKQSKKKRKKERKKNLTYIYPDYQNQRELRWCNHDKRKKKNMKSIL